MLINIVRKIDLDTAKGACWSELPWWNADVGPGDCLYIPKIYFTMFTRHPVAALPLAAGTSDHKSLMLMLASDATILLHYACLAASYDVWCASAATRSSADIEPQISFCCSATTGSLAMIT